MFDPIRGRSNAFTEGMIKYFISDRYDVKAPVGNIGITEIETAIYASLVGVHEVLDTVLPRALAWIQKAIEVDELFGVDRNAHRTALHWANALGCWFESGARNEGMWGAARDHEEARWTFAERPWPRSEILKWGIHDYMAFACQSERPEAGVEMYERWFSGRKISPSKITQPSHLGYAICLDRAGMHQFDGAVLFEAGKRVLEAKLQDTWLGCGQFIRGATWLKIVYEYCPQELSPVETLLKAYENMPSVPRPDFV